MPALAAIDEQVGRIVESRAVRSSASLVRLLQFLVAETQAGRSDRLKEYTLGTEVFGRGADFDPRVDTIVRVQARRLRAKLDEYYQSDGRDDAIVIHLEPGSYVPHFETRPLRAPGEPPPAPHGRWRWLALAATSVAIAGSLLWASYGSARGVVRQPRIRTAPAPGHAINPEAHALYLQAKAAYASGTRDGLSRSVTLFQKAIRADSRYAAAFAGLAYVYLLESSNFVPPAEAMPKAREAAQAALALDDTIVDAHTSLGQIALFYDWDLAAAGAFVDRALALNPYSSTAHDLRAQILTARGRFDDAVVEIQMAQDADPLSATLAYDAAWNLVYARRYAEAAEACRRALEHDPTFELARGLLGLTLVLDGRVSDGIPELERASSKGDSSVLDLLLVHGYAFAGRREDARALLDRVTASARTRYVCAYEVGSAHAAMGDLDRAFAWLSRAINERSDCVVWLGVEPWLDRVRADARFGPLTVRLRPDAASRAGIVGAPTDTGLTR